MASKTEAMAGELGGKNETKVSKGKPTVHTMHIHKHAGGHVAHHFHQPHKPGMEPDHTQVIPNGPGGEGDTDNLTAHVENHMGAPNAGESEMPEGEAMPSAGPEGSAQPGPANLAPAPAAA